MNEDSLTFLNGTNELIRHDRKAVKRCCEGSESSDIRMSHRRRKSTRYAKMKAHHAKHHRGSAEPRRKQNDSTLQSHRRTRLSSFRQPQVRTTTLPLCNSYDDILHLSSKSINVPKFHQHCRRHHKHHARPPLQWCAAMVCHVDAQPNQAHSCRACQGKHHSLLWSLRFCATST